MYGVSFAYTIHPNNIRIGTSLSSQSSIKNQSIQEGYNEFTMFNRLQQIIRTDCGFNSTRIVVIGVSGGPDSLCLLDLLWRLRLPILAAHLNHGLRPEAGEDEAQVRRLAENLGIPFVSSQADVTALSQEQSLSIEEAARILRYHFLFGEATRVGAQAVAVAHTADDQVETVLMHLLRGAGLAGLKGMERVLLPNPWSQEIPLVRPLLEVWRAEILAYCQERGLQPVWDRTNLDSVYLRNRLRHELIPFLETYNPQLRPGLLHMARALRDDYEVMMQAVQAAWQACLVRQGAGYLGFSQAAFCQQLPGVQRHVVRRAVNQLAPGASELGFEEIERVLEFARQPPATKQSDLAAGISLLSEGGILWLRLESSELPVDRWPQVRQAVILPVPGSLDLPGGWRLSAECVGLTPELYSQALANDDPFQAWMDAAEVRALVVRPRHPGDRFQPLGMDGRSLKLSDLMVNIKLPRRARSGWPLVCCGERIAWLPGYALAHPFRLAEGSHTVISLTLVNPPGLSAAHPNLAAVR